MGWSQPGGGCGDVHRTTVLSGALERHQLASAPPSRRCWMAVLPIPPRRAPAQWVRRSGGECECGIVAPMPPPRPNPTPAHPSAHPPSFDDPETETSASNKTSASNDEDEDDAMGRRCRDLPPRARGTRHGADATSAMACDPSSAGASRRRRYARHVRDSGWSNNPPGTRRRRYRPHRRCCDRAGGRTTTRRAIDRDGPMDGGGGGDVRGRFRDPALSTNNTNGGGGSTRG